MLDAAGDVVGARRRQRLAEDERPELVRLAYDRVALGRELAAGDQERGPGPRAPLGDAGQARPGSTPASAARRGRSRRTPASSRARRSSASRSRAGGLRVGLEAGDRAPRLLAPAAPRRSASRGRARRAAAPLRARRHSRPSRPRAGPSRRPRPPLAPPPRARRARSRSESAAARSAGSLTKNASSSRARSRTASVSAYSSSSSASVAATSSSARSSSREESEPRRRPSGRRHSKGVEDGLDVAERRQQRAQRALMSPTSATYQFLAIWSSTWPPYSTMFAPCSANVRATSSSRRGRSQETTAIWTRKLCDAPPSHSTGREPLGVPHERLDVRAVEPVDRDALAERDVAGDLVAGNGRAALGHAARGRPRPRDEDPEVLRGDRLARLGLARERSSSATSLGLQPVEDLVRDLGDLELPRAEREVEVLGLLEAHLADDLGEERRARELPVGEVVLLQRVLERLAAALLGRPRASRACTTGGSCFARARTPRARASRGTGRGSAAST